MLTGLVMAAIRDARPAPAPGKMAAPAPKIFNSAPPRPASPRQKEGAAPPRPESYPGARIGANVPTSSKVFGSQNF